MRRFVQLFEHCQSRAFETQVSKLGRISYDVMFLVKIIHRQVDVDFDIYFSFNKKNMMPEVIHEILMLIALNQTLGGFFSNRVVKLQNELLASIVALSCLGRFKIAKSNNQRMFYCRGRTVELIPQALCVLELCYMMYLVKYPGVKILNLK